MSSQTINPGINPNVELFHFSNEQEDIIRHFAREWYVSNGGKRIEIANSSYSYFLIKPTQNYQQLFNLERELIVGFSDYPTFEPRTLDLFDAAAKRLGDLRIEKVCAVLISKDKNISVKVRDLLKTDAERQIVIPFYFDELLHNKGDHYFIRNRFQEHFYSRDLFAFQAALKKEFYFFGRTDLIHGIVNRHRSGENSGLFGLRKTGKTSVIHGIRRAITTAEGSSIFVDCENPSFHRKRWNTALQHIITQAENSVDVELHKRDDYTNENAAECFESDILSLYKHNGKKSLLIIFDEIEQITPEISPSDHWKNDLDFVFFWQTLRAIFQKHNHLFTYLIVGTNPKSVETPLVNGIDNPIFNQVPHQYIPPFDVPQTREMVRKLGKFMGLKFDELVFAKLNEDFGGHPFLIRCVCSAINKVVDQNRPVRINKTTYEKGKNLFLKQSQSYIDLILSVLKEHYSDEYEMLKYLALDDIKTFNDLAQLSNEYTNHLRGYNILDEHNNEYSFQIDAVKQYLRSQYKYQKLELSAEEALSEISQRRNQLEPALRKIIRQIMTVQYGPGEAKERVARVLGKTGPEFASLSLNDLLNANKSIIYFDDLRKIIRKDWLVFKNLFGGDLETFDHNMKAINKYRSDAHAKEITSDELALFRVCIKQIENVIETYE